MSTVPAQPKIYHITHVDNLPGIVQAGGLWSDAKRIQQGFSCALVGMNEIKRRRVEKLEVTCWPGTKVGEYVPFYFCPRSIMLYLLHQSNHPDLTYRGGQRPIVHLEADLHETAHWANQQSRRWAFTTANAGTWYTQHHKTLPDLSKVDWAAVQATNFQSPAIKEGKQAEFLIYEYFPWCLVRRIGVIDNGVQAQVQQALANASHRPVVSVEQAWYY